MIDENTVALNGAPAPAETPKKAAPPKGSAIYGKKLCKARKAKGLTQTALAKSMKVAQGTISSIETGRTAPSPALKAKLAKKLGMK